RTGVQHHTPPLPAYRVTMMLIFSAFNLIDHHFLNIRLPDRILNSVAIRENLLKQVPRNDRL
ncbi:MAG TPA: hypothetical protein VF177_21435, partial [Anaerolineae bacterium]